MSTTNSPNSMSLTKPQVHRDAPVLAAADLAQALLDAGWTLTGTAVRVIHTARLGGDAGLTVAVSSEAGKIRLDFDSEYRNLGGYLSRLAWHAEATRELPVEVLAAVASANAAASDDDPTDVGEMLTAAGWSQLHSDDRSWTSPDETREVQFIDDELVDTTLPWSIRCEAGRPVTIDASADTPAAVIVAFAVTEAHPL